MSIHIQTIKAIEILDSRGSPTVRAMVALNNGVTASVSIPSGVSTGWHETYELRDRDPKRYWGMGVLKAVDNINTIIASELKGFDPCNQLEIDYRLQDIDGTLEKTNLGGNAILAVSLAVAKAAAESRKLPLYKYLGGSNATQIPMPLINVINGGKHANNGLDFQEFMIVPIGAPTFSEALRYSVETFNNLREILLDNGYITSLGDEGGFAPRLKRNDEACELIVKAIEKAQFIPGEDIAIAIDSAATNFYRNNYYNLTNPESQKNSIQMIEMYQDWIKKYPIISIEDGLAENDRDGFCEMTKSMGDTLQIVGDDILVTQPKLILEAINDKICNAVLIKLNQIGTLTETIDSIRLCHKYKWNYIVSHRAGETEDTFIADFAVAMGAGQIKAGSINRSERVAKYNRLLEIESELDGGAQFINPFSEKKSE